MIIGLTGAIGSGKSSVATCFMQLGIPVFDADAIARALSAPGEAGFLRIIDHFGENAMGEDGKLDRDYLREVIFSDPNQREVMNQLIHPLVFETLQAHSQAAFDTEQPYCVWDVPLLIGGYSEQLVDRILVVNTPIATRKTWIQARNGWDDAMIEAVMTSQTAPETLLSHADDVIHNLGTKTDLCNEVDDLHQIYLKLSRNQARAKADTAKPNKG